MAILAIPCTGRTPANATSATIAGASPTALLEGLVDIKRLFLLQKQAEHLGTISVYEKIPPDHLDWCPAADMLTLGQMARHVWKSEQGTRRVAIENDWSYYQTRIPQGLLAILGEVKSLDKELEEMKRVHEETLRAAAAFPLERWDEPRENATFNFKWTAGVVLFRIIEHQIHHRAQVGTCLRILTGRRASPYPL
jgi:uncharacterized damage-inducible protein DinB